MTEPEAPMPADDRNPYAAPETRLVSNYRARALQTRLADRATRLAAALINGVLAAFAMIPGAILLFVVLPERLEFVDGYFWMFSTAGLILYSGVFLLWIYQAFLLTRDGQSIGKKLLNIKIVRYDNGAQGGFLRVVLVREVLNGLVGFVPWVAMVYPWTDPLFIFGPERRCLHDYIAGTKVVTVARARPRRQYRRPPVPPAGTPSAPSDSPSDAAPTG